MMQGNLSVKCTEADFVRNKRLTVCKVMNKTPSGLRNDV